MSLKDEYYFFLSVTARESLIYFVISFVTPNNQKFNKMEEKFCILHNINNKPYVKKFLLQKSISFLQISVFMMHETNLSCQQQNSLEISSMEKLL